MLAGPTPGRLSGLRITRIVRPARCLQPLASPNPQRTCCFRRAAGTNSISEIIADHPVERVAIADALPAGLEAVDTTFATTSPAPGTLSASWPVGDRQIHTDRIGGTDASRRVAELARSRGHSGKLWVAGRRRPPSRHARGIESQRRGDRRGEVNADRSKPRRFAASRRSEIRAWA
jgi:hypothetical protein